MSEDPNITFLPEDRDDATDWLNSLLNKNLRVSVTDGRMFWGQFKCVDAESNIILHSAYEYRFPTSSQVAAAVTSSSSVTPTPTGTTITSSSALSAPSDSDPSLSATPQEAYESATSSSSSSSAGKVKVDLTSRHLGLVVIPGQYITKIELEEFASQVRARNRGFGQGFHPGWRDGGIS
ncbi:hypothetical protein NCU07497 [Neurospora crassa OR74A]|uniref:Sm domain-containing protein n=1 Tax=Neurospora crassa (strain ATCC 24698 / 74-OR23-1A / CBS 708.71 / DSM 1257 / FGSC 987) TaxID=367110 RepID=Q7SG45_NEUCR|nr:hypothetical protein NCU07497 [Neurospora crassa OR74A]EAA35808.1 hypothetical protein NCU07497 [Neurospora crassa OR74A]|eukprot:XP_965044.1 hypothetical protein NCU07497 [Neurospora crassa OR74A]